MEINFYSLLNLKKGTRITVNKKEGSYQGTLEEVLFNYSESICTYELKGGQLVELLMLPLSFKPTELPSHIKAIYAPVGRINPYVPIVYKVYNLIVSLATKSGVRKETRLEDLDLID